MAIELKTGNMSTGEVRTFFVDYTNDLPEGVTVESATAVHTPPSGSATQPSVTVLSPFVNVQVGELGVVGTHVVEVLAQLSNGDKSSTRLIIPVVY